MAAAAYLAHPITGIGSGGFARQQNTLYLQISDAFTPEYESAYGTLSTHNTVLGVAAETGTLGLIAYVFWIVAVGQVIVSVVKTKAFCDEAWIVVACTCLAAMMFEDWWGQASFIPPSTCLLGLVLGWLRSQHQLSGIAIPIGQSVD
jgi:O-antigen ligase